MKLNCQLVCEANYRISNLCQEITMGYTHYFENKQDCPPEDWAKIADAFKRLQATAIINNDPLLIQEESDSASAPGVDGTGIWFNGIESDGCETFHLTRKGSGRFNCCKTRQRPYDRVVIAVLCLANFFAPGVWDIDSDGNVYEWGEGLALALTVEPNCPMPGMLRKD
jgi:hypothetical protein